MRRYGYGPASILPLFKKSSFPRVISASSNWSCRSSLTPRIRKAAGLIMIFVSCFSRCFVTICQQTRQPVATRPFCISFFLHQCGDRVGGIAIKTNSPLEKTYWKKSHQEKLTQQKSVIRKKSDFPIYIFFVFFTNPKGSHSDTARDKQILSYNGGR